MTAFQHVPGFRQAPAARAARRVRAAHLAGVLLAGGACLLAVGCSGTSGSSSTAAGPSRAAPGSHGTGTADGRGAAGAPSAFGTSGEKSRLTTLPAPGHQSIIYTASLTVRSEHVATAASQAAQLAKDTGGYVSSEHTTVSPRQPAGGSVYLQLKVPAAAYPATLAAVARLGTRVSQSQQARDVTQTVADVTSRVTSAQQAITQL